MKHIPPPGYSARWPHMSAMRRAASWWTSAAYLAEDAASGLTLPPAAIMDFSAGSYALWDGWWQSPEYAATQSANGDVGYASAVLDFSGGQYAG